MIWLAALSFAIVLGHASPIRSDRVEQPATGHLYLVNEVIESSARLRKGEKILWYGAIPADVAIHGFAGFMLGGPWLAAAMAGTNAWHAGLTVMAAEYGRLQLEATYRARKVVEAVSAIPDNEVLSTMSLAGGVVERSGPFITQIKRRAIYFLNLAKPLSEKFAMDVPDTKNAVRRVSFLPIDRPEDVSFEFQIVNSQAAGRPWTLSLQDMSNGVQLSRAQLVDWGGIYDLDPELTRVELKVNVGRQTIQLGSFTEGHGVKALLGRNLWGRVSYHVRKTLFGDGVQQGKKLRLKQTEKPAPLPPAVM